MLYRLAKIVMFSLLIHATTSMAKEVLIEKEEIKTHCPLISEIYRTPGEYSWNSKVPGWDGFFYSPRSAQGGSTELINFREARWIQLTNLPTSDGFVQCDYTGDYGDEIIRFTMSGRHVAEHPRGPQWIQEQHISFPNVQAVCTDSERRCSFVALSH